MRSRPGTRRHAALPRAHGGPSAPARSSSGCRSSARQAPRQSCSGNSPLPPTAVQAGVSCTRPTRARRAARSASAGSSTPTRPTVRSAGGSGHAGRARSRQPCRRPVSCTRRRAARHRGIRSRSVSARPPSRRRRTPRPARRRAWRPGSNRPPCRSSVMCTRRRESPVRLRELVGLPVRGGRRWRRRQRETENGQREGRVAPRDRHRTYSCTTAAGPPAPKLAGYSQTARKSNAPSRSRSSRSAKSPVEIAGVKRS